jgi:hypothetical protein
MYGKAASKRRMKTNLGGDERRQSILASYGSSIYALLAAASLTTLHCLNGN